jgi:DNA-binding transcriptional ArsR family regulator
VNRNGFTKIPNHLYERALDRELSWGAFLTLQLIIAHSWREGWCRLTQDTLAQHLGRKERMIRNYLSELRAAGLIESEQPGFGRSNRYRPTLSQSGNDPRAADPQSGNGLPVKSGNQLPVIEEDGIEEDTSLMKEQREVVVVEAAATSPNGNAGSVYTPFEAKREEYIEGHRRKYGRDPDDVPTDQWELHQRIRSLEVEW